MKVLLRGGRIKKVDLLRFDLRGLDVAELLLEVEDLYKLREAIGEGSPVTAATIEELIDVLVAAEKRNRFGGEKPRLFDKPDRYTVSDYREYEKALKQQFKIDSSLFAEIYPMPDFSKGIEPFIEPDDMYGGLLGED